MRFFIIASILFAAAIAHSQTPVPVQPLKLVPWEIERTQTMAGNAPVYPSIAAIAHVQGCVYLRIIVSTDGTIQQPPVFLGGLVLMRDSALTAAKTWRFKPSDQVILTVSRVCYFLPGSDASKLLAADSAKVQQHPTDAAKTIAFGNELLLFGLPDQAETYFRRALSLKSDDAEAVFGLGDSLAARGDFRAAGSAYQMLLTTSDSDTAIKRYKKALGSDQHPLFWREPFLRYSLGQALENKGDKKGALKEYGTAAKEMPWSSEFQEAYRRISGIAGSNAEH